MSKYTIADTSEIIAEFPMATAADNDDIVGRFRFRVTPCAGPVPMAAQRVLCKSEGGVMHECQAAFVKRWER